MSHILLVDSDALLEDVFADALVAAGYSVTEAGTHLSAAEAIAAQAPALLVVDFDDGRASAQAMLEWLGEQPAHASMPVLAIASDVSGLPPSLPSLQKPFSVALLLQAVRTLTAVSA